MTHALPSRLQSLQQNLIERRAAKRLVLQNGDVGFASAPSNIALIKYWGKRHDALQQPLNSSVSLTLGDFRSTTKLVLRGCLFPEDERSTAMRPTCEIILNHKKSLADKKLLALWQRMSAGWGDELGFELHTKNNFPTACGIASSASGFAAFVGAVADLLQLSKLWSHEDLQYWLCEWARLGSGSATRSAILGASVPFCAWEKINDFETKTFAIQSFWTSEIRSLVVVVSDSEKEVSSSAGHSLVDTSALQMVRLAGVKRQYDSIQEAIAKGDFDTLATLCETDAFAMHAVMQSCEPPLKYLGDETAQLIAAFVQWRDTHRIQACWSLDAGPNLHIIYSKKDCDFVIDFFANQILKMLGRSFKIMTNTHHAGLALGRQCYFEKDTE